MGADQQTIPGVDAPAEQPNLPAERPRCSTHPELYMVLRTGSMSKEQEWCGTWYDCPHPLGCRNACLFPSFALESQLAEQAAVHVSRRR